MNKIKFKGIGKIDKDSVFIRLSDFDDQYVHPNGKTCLGEQKYIIKTGTIGAAIWLKKDAETLIKLLGHKNLETVKVINVLGADLSLN